MSKKSGKAARIASSPEAMAAAQAFAAAFAPSKAAERASTFVGCLFGACDRTFSPHSVGRAQHRGCAAGGLVYAAVQRDRKAGVPEDQIRAKLVAQIRAIDPAFEPRED